MKNLILLSMSLSLDFFSDGAAARCVNKDPDFCCRTIGVSYCKATVKATIQCKLIITE